MKMTTLELTIEKGQEGLWGTLNYNDNLITGQAETLADLEAQLKATLKDFENIDPANIKFEHTYDVFALFQAFDFLNISKVAKYAEINAGLLRQYAAGVKHPSLKQAKKIEETLHQLASQLQKASVYAG
ncbi:MAG: hypothetical protein EOP41_01820 [Sphingobacteriaceae bacterium]|nr:MAG: hypothetical protein EOP41_01820 [Sphingobacteriaceae bacterium]